MRRGPLPQIRALFFLAMLFFGCSGWTDQVDEPYYVTFDPSVPGQDQLVILQGFMAWSQAIPDLVVIVPGADPEPPTPQECSHNVYVRYTTSKDPSIVLADARYQRTILAVANRGCRLKTVTFVIDRWSTSDQSMLYLISGHEMGHVLGIWQHHQTSNVGLMSPGYPGVIPITCEDVVSLCEVKVCNPYRYTPCSNPSNEGGLTSP